MRPELPFLAAGAVALVGGTARAKGFPPNGLNAVVGTTVLVIVASTTAGSKVAPLVHAIGLLLLMASVMAATRSFRPQPQKKVTK